MKYGTFIKIIIEGEDGWLNINKIIAFGETDGEFEIALENNEVFNVDEKTYCRIIKLFNLIDLTTDDFLSKVDVEI